MNNTSINHRKTSPPIPIQDYPLNRTLDKGPKPPLAADLAAPVYAKTCAAYPEPTTGGTPLAAKSVTQVPYRAPYPFTNDQLTSLARAAGLIPYRVPYPIQHAEPVKATVVDPGDTNSVPFARVIGRIPAGVVHPVRRSQAEPIKATVISPDEAASLPRAHVVAGRIPTIFMYPISQTSTTDAPSIYPTLQLSRPRANAAKEIRALLYSEEALLMATYADKTPQPIGYREDMHEMRVYTCRYQAALATGGPLPAPPLPPKDKEEEFDPMEQGAVTPPTSPRR